MSNSELTKTTELDEEFQSREHSPPTPHSSDVEECEPWEDLPPTPRSSDVEDLCTDEDNEIQQARVHQLMKKYRVGPYAENKDDRIGSALSPPQEEENPG